VRLLPRREERADPLERLRSYAHVQVRAGFLRGERLRAHLQEVAAEDVGGDDPAGLSARVLADALDEASAEQRAWPAVTDHDRLQTAFARMRDAGIEVLEGVDDHWRATAELERLDDSGVRPAGIAWFTLPDVWHAVDHGMLEVNLWHGDSANVAPGDALLDLTLGAFAAAGLEAHFDEGRIEVAAAWQRRL
jgi:hypothetical protein